MKKYGKIAAALLAVMISASSTGMYALANKDKLDTDAPKNANPSDDTRSVRETSDEPQEKAETVYVMTDASGKKTKTIVSDWLKNYSGDDSVTDVSDLTDITRLKLDGGFSADGSDITWSANGGDVYYKGYSSDELPVDIKITYKLNGETISPEELAGKSGRVTVRYDYINNSKKTVTAGGKQIEMYTPFMMATGVLLDGEKFTDIKAVNGKVVSDGDRIVVIGCAFPGLTESLGLADNDDISIPEYFEFTAYVTDFEMKTTITSGTSSIFSDLDLGSIKEIDELEDKLGELTDASEKLCSGTGELASGIATLKNSSGDLVNGVDALVSGDSQLDTGINALAAGTEQLLYGVQTLDDSTQTFVDGVSSAKSGSDELVKGFKAAENGIDSLKGGASSLGSGLSKADEVAKTVNDGAQALVQGASALGSGASDLASGVSAVADGTSTLAASAGELDKGANALVQGTASAKQGADSLSAGIAQAGSGAEAVADGIAQAGAGLDLLAEGTGKDAQALNAMGEQISGAADQLDTTVAYNMQVIEGLKAMQANYEASSSEYQQFAVMIGTLEQTTAGQSQIAAGLKSGAESSVDQISSLTVGVKQLQAAFNGDGTAQNPGLVAGSRAVSDAFDNGLIAGSQALAAGVSELNSGAEALATGTGQLVTGTAALDEGAQRAAVGAATLSSSSAQLAGGAQALAQGTQTLSEGITAANIGASQLSYGAAALGDGIAKLSAGENKLNGGLAQLASGGSQLKGGTSTLSSSVWQLNDGAQTLKSGSGELFNGLTTLQSKMPYLVSGVNQLADGSQKFDSGMKDFNRKGIDKIISTYDNDLKPLYDRLGMLSDLSRDYGSFSGSAQGVETEVRFIYETDPIRVHE